MGGEGGLSVGRLLDVDCYKIMIVASLWGRMKVFGVGVKRFDETCDAVRFIGI